MAEMKIGIDIIAIDRIKRIVNEYGERFLNRSFHHEEIAYANSKSNTAARLAGFWCAKEAAVKALGGKIFDYWVSHNANGMPILMSGESKVNATLSISHEQQNAIAVVVAHDEQQ